MKRIGDHPAIREMEGSIRIPVSDPPIKRGRVYHNGVFIVAHDIDYQVFGILAMTFSPLEELGGPTTLRRVFIPYSAIDLIAEVTDE